MFKYIEVIPGRPKPKPKFNTTKMLNKKQVLEMVGVSPTNPIKNEVFKALPTYKNRFNSQAIFKEEDVLEIIHNFPVNS